MSYVLSYFMFMIMPALVAAALLAFVPRAVRWVILLAGLLLLATGLHPATSGGHNPLGLLPLLGLGLAAGALLVEAAVFVRSRVMPKKSHD